MRSKFKLPKCSRTPLRRRCAIFACLFLALALVPKYSLGKDYDSSNLIVSIDIVGPINPATDDFLKTSIQAATQKNAKLLIINLNTPGGLLPSMQTMVEQILESPIPVVVYVTPSGGGAMSAGVFITLAGHVAVMAPGTTIGAAHPVTGDGQDVTGDMRAKVENFAVSLITAISEQRGRNVEWAEKAVRESVAITDREALELKVIDFISADTDKLLAQLEGRTVNVKGTPVTLEKLSQARRESLNMSFKQKVVNILSDPNIVILLGLGAMLGIGIELYHPGAILPGVFGAICLVLSLTAAQVIPINYGGVALLLLAVAFFIVELMVPSFGIWGFAGIICLVLGSIYLVDTELVWGVEGFAVDKLLIGSIAGTVGVIFLLVSYLAVKAYRHKVSTGQEGIIDQVGKVLVGFSSAQDSSTIKGKIQVMGEIWNAVLNGHDGQSLSRGESVRVVAVKKGMILVVEACSAGK